MNAPCDAFSAALEGLRGEISCRPSHDGTTLVILTGRYFADGDAVELMLRPSEDGERVVVSDGGLTRARLDLAGTDLGAARPKALWRDIIAEFGVREMSDRVFVRGKASAAAASISLLADACVALDTVRLLTAGERQTFADKVRLWLRSEAHLDVQESTSVVDRWGEPQTVTALVESPRGEVVVQAASGRNISDLRGSMEHAFWVMGGLIEAQYPIANRLTLVESVPTRPASRDRMEALVRRLTDASYVGSFEGQISAKTFLSIEEPPSERDFVFQSLGQIETPERVREYRALPGEGGPPKGIESGK